MKTDIIAYVKDFLILNIAAGAITLFIALFGSDILNVFFLILLFFSAFLFLIGGATGFFLSAASYESFKKILGGIARRITRTGYTKEEAKKTKEEREKEIKRSVMTGKKLILLGGLLLLESLLISLPLIL